jgi:hypothetical protein
MLSGQAARTRKTCFRYFSRLDSLAETTHARLILVVRRFLKPVVTCVFAGQRIFLIEHVVSFRRRPAENHARRRPAREGLMYSSLQRRSIFLGGSDAQKNWIARKGRFIIT